MRFDVGSLKRCLKYRYQAFASSFIEVTEMVYEHFGRRDWVWHADFSAVAIGESSSLFITVNAGPWQELAVLRVGPMLLEMSDWWLQSGEKRDLSQREENFNDRERSNALVQESSVGTVSS